MLSRKQVMPFLRANFATGELFWKFNYQRPDLIGERVGHLNQGYWRLALNGEEYYCAQIIWLLYYDEWPKDTIDHKDLDKSFDGVTNLRLSNKAQNAANSKISSRNTTGFKGVSLCKATNRYRASICVNGTRKNLGRYNTPEEAHEVWKAAAIEAFGEEFVRAA